MLRDVKSASKKVHTPQNDHTYTKRNLKNRYPQRPEHNQHRHTNVPSHPWSHTVKCRIRSCSLPTSQTVAVRTWLRCCSVSIRGIGRCGSYRGERTSRLLSSTVKTQLRQPERSWIISRLNRSILCVWPMPSEISWNCFLNYDVSSHNSVLK